MRLLCELIASDIMPTLRALITRELLESHQLSQMDISKKLGITQPAVSQYAHGFRGGKVKRIIANKKLMVEIKKLSQEIASKNYTPADTHLKICQLSERLITKSYPGKTIYPGPCTLRRKGHA